MGKSEWRGGTIHSLWISTEYAKTIRQTEPYHCSAWLSEKRHRKLGASAKSIHYSSAPILWGCGASVVIHKWDAISQKTIPHAKGLLIFQMNYFMHQDKISILCFLNMKLKKIIKHNMNMFNKESHYVYAYYACYVRVWASLIEHKFRCVLKKDEYHCSLL